MSCSCCFWIQGCGFLSYGEVFKLSREMGHSTIQVTETYLKDFRSAEARRAHTAFSPISQLDLNQTKRSDKQNKKQK